MGSLKFTKEWSRMNSMTAKTGEPARAKASRLTRKRDSSMKRDEVSRLNFPERTVTLSIRRIVNMKAIAAIQPKYLVGTDRFSSKCTCQNWEMVSKANPEKRKSISRARISLCDFKTRMLCLMVSDNLDFTFSETFLSSSYFSLIFKIRKRQRMRNSAVNGTHTNFMFNEAKYPPRIRPRRLPALLNLVPAAKADFTFSSLPSCFNESTSHASKAPDLRVSPNPARISATTNPARKGKKMKTNPAIREKTAERTTEILLPYISATSPVGISKSRMDASKTAASRAISKRFIW